jgi:hypothetical protein
VIESVTTSGVEVAEEERRTPLGANFRTREPSPKKLLSHRDLLMPPPRQ